MTNAQLNAYNYNINEPRYSDLYKQYFRFFNTNLNRIDNVQARIKKLQDLNNDEKRQILNPDSYNYDIFFDGFDE